MVRSFAQMVESFSSPARDSRNLVDEAWQEADRHKWIESKKLGYDAGEAAQREWFRCYWRIFCRRKWLQHLEGKSCWSNFSERRFGALTPIPVFEDPEFRCILHLAYCGEENLDMLLLTSSNEKLRRDKVMKALNLLDVNESRLRCPIGDN